MQRGEYRDFFHTHADDTTLLPPLAATPPGPAVLFLLTRTQNIRSLFSFFAPTSGLSPLPPPLVRRTRQETITLGFFLSLLPVPTLCLFVLISFLCDDWEEHSWLHKNVDFCIRVSRVNAFFFLVSFYSLYTLPGKSGKGAILRFLFLGRSRLLCVTPSRAKGKL